MDHCKGRDTTCHWQDSSLLQANPLSDFGRERVLKFKFKTRTMNSGSVSTAIFPVWIGEHSITWIRFRNASAGKHITENCWNPGRLYKLAKSESRGPGPVLVSSEQSLCTVTGNTTRILCKTRSCLNFGQARSRSLEWLLAAAQRRPWPSSVRPSQLGRPCPAPDRNLKLTRLGMSISCDSDGWSKVNLPAGNDVLTVPVQPGPSGSGSGKTMDRNSSSLTVAESAVLSLFLIRNGPFPLNRHALSCHLRLSLLNSGTDWAASPHRVTIWHLWRCYIKLSSVI